jgi:hypothetical protein
MNREGAETYLRLLAEAQLRGWLAAAPRAPWAAGPGNSRAKMMAVGQALTAVGALDGDTVEEILADFALAVSVRQIHDQAIQAGQVSQGGQGAKGPGPGATAAGPTPAGAMRAAAMARWTAQSQAVRATPLIKASLLARAVPPGRAALPEPADPAHDRSGPDRFVPVGLTVPFRGEGFSGELHLISFAHTGSGARFIALWAIHTVSLQRQAGLEHPELIPFGQFTVTDNRGARYDLEFTAGGGPEWISQVSLSPTPPDDIRWLDVAAPLSPVTRISLVPENPGATVAKPRPDAEPRVSDVKLSPGEHLLTMLAERLLTLAPDFPRHLQGPRSALSPGPLQAMAAALGDITAALEAADVLPPASPLLAQLATLCASLGIDGHGITVPPARDLPEPWLSLLAHYQRRKPDPVPARDGCAAVAADLPEVDGIRLALLGLHTVEGNSSLHVLARGLTADGRPGPLGIDLDFPLSIWLRDSGGRWHAACPAGWHRPGPGNRECAIRLRLVPPLPRSTPWVEVLAGGRSAEVRARLPLRWGFP